MKDHEKILLNNMDDKSVEEIAEFTEGLDIETKMRILENCRRKMNRDTEDNESRVIDMNENKEKNLNETTAEIRKDEGKNRYFKTIISVAACFCIIAGAAVILSSFKDSENTIHTTPDIPAQTTQETADFTKEEEAAAQTQENEAVTENTVTEQSAVTVIEYVSETVLSDEEKTVETEISPETVYLDIFKEMSEGIGKAFMMIEGFGVDFVYDDNRDYIFLDAKTKEKMFAADFFASDVFSSDYMEAREVCDELIHSNDDFVNYVYSYFADSIKNFSKDEQRIIEYEGRNWVAVPQKGYLFGGFRTDTAEITDYSKDEYFIVKTYDESFEISEETAYELTFINTDAGWRVSKIMDAGYAAIE